MSDDTQSTFTDIKKMVELNFEECVRTEDWKRFNDHIMTEIKAFKLFNKENNKRFIEIDG